MTLYKNNQAEAKIFIQNNKNHKNTNQEIFRENFFQSMIKEQKQLNKSFTKTASENAQKNEMYNQALLEQISFQEKLLQEMYRKLQEYEQTSNSLYEQMHEQTKINDIIKRQSDLQTIYHQTVMERIDKQESTLKNQNEQSTQKLMEFLELQQNVIQDSFVNQGDHIDQTFSKLDHSITANLNGQEHKFSELVNTHKTDLADQFQDQNVRLDQHFGDQQITLQQLFKNQDNQLNERFEQHDALNENLDRKLDFIKSTIFERAADLSEKLDGQFRKFTDLFTNFFAKQETPHHLKINDNKRLDKERKEENVKI